MARSLWRLLRSNKRSFNSKSSRGNSSAGVQQRMATEQQHIAQIRQFQGRLHRLSPCLREIRNAALTRRQPSGDRVARYFDCRTSTTRRRTMKTYDWWGGQNPPPSHLTTAKQLQRKGLYPRKAVGVIYGRGGSKLYLYNRRDRNSVMEASEWDAMRKRDRAAARNWARDLLQREDWVVLDTETTGLRDPELCEIAILDCRGKTLLDTLVKPSKPIEASATAVHGITNAEVRNAPTAGRIYPEIQNAIAARVAVIYNQAFDRKVLKTAFGFRPLITKGFLDPMPYYAQCRGEWNGYRGEYQYPKLGGNHRALGDCWQVLKIIREMAQLEP